MQLMQGDCLELMKDIPDGSIDMVLCDLPYGSTKCEWDKKICLNDLWAQYDRIAKPNAAIVLFCKQPYASEIIISNIQNFRYEIIWDKNALVDFANSNNKPVNVHENIEVFYKSRPTYNRIDDEGYKAYSDKRKTRRNSDLSCDGFINKMQYENKTTRTPTTIRRYFQDNKRGLGKFHPTQKPIALLEWLIKSYTNQGQTVLDNCMGSGSTGVACINTGRDFIGIELDKGYFDIAKKRIEDASEVVNNG